MRSSPASCHHGQVISRRILSYEIEEDDGSRMKFQFKLTTEGKAELRFVDAPIKIKPIRFERRH